MRGDPEGGSTEEGSWVTHDARFATGGGAQEHTWHVRPERASGLGRYARR